MNNKYFFLTITLILSNLIFGQYPSQTGLRIMDATAATPSPGVKFWGSGDTDGFLYSSKFINGYGFGFYNKSNGNAYNNGTNTYLSGFFGIDFFTNSQARLRINRDGNVGIGLDNPNASLHVNGDIKTNQKFLFGNSELTPDQGGAFVLNANTATATPYIDFNRFGETSNYTSRFALLAPQVYTNNEPKLTLLGSTLSLPHGVEFLNSPWGNGFGAKIYGTDNGNGTTSLRFGTRHNAHAYTDAMVIKTESGNVGIGTVEPTEKLQIGNNFTFSSGGHDIIGFGFTPSNSTDLNTNAYSAEIRLKKNSGSLSIGISQDLVSNPTPAIEIWKNNNVTMSYYDWGKVGIGTNNPDAKLTVNGDIHAKEVRIDLNIAPDYVFEKYYDGYSTLKSDYKMPTLQEVEAYTKENKHLPEVPSAQEIKENGLKLGEMNAILLQKVEELTLYLIEQNKEIEKLKTKVDELSKK
ncbi:MULTISPECIES: hypothetical protein [Flavobacterium]|uniref:Uncharacterized protein n=1 Tax=Flavobacterium jumunjinense TaxID=998845 RepID=A0ABV5GSU9_9FLAO|nr:MULTISPECIES: hypothetical protein [Flavobacterium]